MNALSARVSAWHRRAVAAGALVVVVGFAGFGAVLAMVRENDDLARLDDPVLHALAAARSPGLTRFMRMVSAVTGPSVLPYVVVAAAVVWIVVRREWWRPVLLVVATGTASLLGLTLKIVVARPRPPLDLMDVPGSEPTASFPSGHTLGTATVLLVAGYLVWRGRPDLARAVGWGLAAVLGTALVGLSRLYLGYHYVSDVVASVLLAVAVLGIVVLVDVRHVAHLAHERARRRSAQRGTAG